MSKHFLRLSSGLILNPRFIHNIQINPNYITIHVVDFDIKGWHFFSFGHLSSSNSFSYIYEKDKNKDEYNEIMKWIENNT